MPRFSVLLHIRGPFRHADGPEVFDGAYTHRIVTAPDAAVAVSRAVEILRNEERFRSLRAGSLDGVPRIDADEVNALAWWQGRGGTPGWVLYDETKSHDSKNSSKGPRASA